MIGLKPWKNKVYVLVPLTVLLTSIFVCKGLVGFVNEVLNYI